jgi:hypothetical protein
MKGCRVNQYVLLLCVQSRARAGSEASELRAALDAISKEKAAISEQLAVLKTQLCFVLQVSRFLHRLVSTKEITGIV